MEKEFQRQISRFDAVLDRDRRTERQTSIDNKNRG